MTTPAAIEDLCRRWFGRGVLRVAPLRDGGFSGSAVFTVDRDDGDRFVLKRFHDGTTREHAHFVHGIAAHLRDVGIGEAPDVIVAREGGTVVEDRAGGLWEIVRFVPGEPLERPADAQAAAALALLARIHVALGRYPHVAPRDAQPPGLVRRVEQSRRLRITPWRRRLGEIDSDASHVPALAAVVAPRLAVAGDMFEACGGDAFLERVGSLALPTCRVQVVLRDVWFDHVLFADRRAARVTGIIDLHAAGIDTPATDIARLLGSWEAREGDVGRPLCERWEGVLAAYEGVRPLDTVERRLVPLLHATGIVLGLDNWFRWTLEERRHFPDADRVLSRIDRLLRELPHALSGGGMTADGRV